MIKIEIDDIHRLYIYRQKVLLKEKKGSKWVTRVVTKNPSDILDSTLVNDKLKQKIKEKLDCFFKNRG